VLTIAYSIGLGLPFVLLAAGFSWATKSVGFVRKHIRGFNIAGGVLLIVLGLLLVTGLWNNVIEYFQVVNSDFFPAL
jgi:cytochrome c-type biogenesis protein